jgi:pimeloyl-ACP methyl ester carboxylesterase
MTESGRERPSTPSPEVRTVESAEKIVLANGVDLCVETIGDRADPPILLIHGAAASLLAWEDGFCERLAAGSRYVIRYDHRDTGRSVSYEPGAPPYTLRDLVADAVGLLDAFGLDEAHLVGRSMGGGIAMLAALDYPDRVASLTLVGTSPGGSDLPPMSEEFLAHVGGAGNPDWSDREAVIDHVIGMLRVFSGGSGHLDEATTRDLVSRDLDRTVNVASSQINHFVMEMGEPLRERLGEIGVPTLVVHGAEDPVFPLGHAIALEKEIAGARLLALERTGHELPRATWDVVVPAILQHTSGGRLRHEESQPDDHTREGTQ